MTTRFTYEAWDGFDIMYIAFRTIISATTMFREAAGHVLSIIQELKVGQHLPYGYGWININDAI
jgi:hypothetical protein